MMQAETGVHDRPPGERARRWLMGVWRPIEMTMAGVLALWGVLLMLPVATFSSPAYAAFGLFGLSETEWGLLFLAVAAMLSGGLALQQRRLRVAGLVASAGLFAFVATMLGMGNPSGFGWAGNAGYVALCLVALRRLDW